MSTYRKPCKCIHTYRAKLHKKYFLAALVLFNDRMVQTNCRTFLCDISIISIFFVYVNLKLLYCYFSPRSCTFTTFIIRAGYVSWISPANVIETISFTAKSDTSISVPLHSKAVSSASKNTNSPR